MNGGAWWASLFAWLSDHSPTFVAAFLGALLGDTVRDWRRKRDR